MARLNVQANPEEVLLFMEASQIFYARGQYDQAERVLQGALVLSPENPDVYACLGAVCQVQGRWDEALDYLQRSLKTCPSEKCARTNLAQLLLQEGSVTEATQELELALADMTPDHPTRARTEAMLDIARAIDQFQAPAE
ncbi:MAG: tetratricopeptide repeat protein [Acidobacteria bacterium]|nr:tetratricopeptide repeat protein [Acidobacteriota bacterium]